LSSRDTPPERDAPLDAADDAPPTGPRARRVRFGSPLMHSLRRPDGRTLVWALALSLALHVTLELTVGLIPSGGGALRRGEIATYPAYEPPVRVRMKLAEPVAAPAEPEPPEELALPELPEPAEPPEALAEAAPPEPEPKPAPPKPKPPAKPTPEAPAEAARPAAEAPVSAQAPAPDPPVAKALQKIQSKAEPGQAADAQAEPPSELDQAGTALPGAGGSGGAADATGAGSADGGPRGDGALGPPAGGGGDPKKLLRKYLRQVAQAIRKDYAYPRAARRIGVEGEAVVLITIDAQGKVVGVELSQSSGHKVLDEAALEAARSVAQVPPPPVELGWTRKSVRVPFSFSMG
jgi:protein TonB